MNLAVRSRRLLIPAAILWFAAVAFPSAAAVPRDSTSRRAELVELVTLDSAIRLDIRYATANNFMKRPMYAQARAFLQRPAALALLRAYRRLRPDGYGLLVFDGYRPWSVTKKFWDETPPSKRTFVANPRKGSRHNRGCAVDLSLFDLATGKEVQMPSPYDDFTAMASTQYPGGGRRSSGGSGTCSVRRWKQKDSPANRTSGGISTTKNGVHIPSSTSPSNVSTEKKVSPPPG